MIGHYSPNNEWNQSESNRHSDVIAFLLLVEEIWMISFHFNSFTMQNHSNHYFILLIYCSIVSSTVSCFNNNLLVTIIMWDCFSHWYMKTMIIWCHWYSLIHELWGGKRCRRNSVKFQKTQPITRIDLFVIKYMDSSYLRLKYH